MRPKNDSRRLFVCSACVGILAVVLCLNKPSYSENTEVVPGVRAENFILGQEENIFLQSVQGQLVKRVIADGSGALFRDLFQVSLDRDIAFDRLYSLEEKGVRVCIRNGHVEAVISDSRSRTLADNLSLDGGASRLVYQFGNRGLFRIQENGNTLYIYLEKGIAFADDGNDDTVDLYVVFIPVSSSSSAPLK